MSSTFAPPVDLPAGPRLPRLRRRPTRQVPTSVVATRSAHPVEAAPAVCATTARTVTTACTVATADPVDGRSVLPFLRTPASWQVVGCRPVSYLDHVILTPSAVLAVTTRFYLEADGDDHVKRAWSDIRTAKGAAKLLELTIGGVEGPHPADVRAVLVLWGPGAPELEKGYLLIKGVVVLDPSRPELWSHLFDAPLLNDDTIAALLEALRTLQVNSTDTPIALAG